MKLQKFFGRVLIFQAVVLCCAVSTCAQTTDSASQPTWIPLSVGQAIPDGAFQISGKKSNPYYFCRAKHYNGIYPGEVVSGGRCGIIYFGVTEYKDDFEVLVGLEGAWGAPGKTEKPLVVGIYPNSQPIQLCRAEHSGGVRQGSVSDGMCDIKQKVAKFEVFYQQQQQKKTTATAGVQENPKKDTTAAAQIAPKTEPTVPGAAKKETASPAIQNAANEADYKKALAEAYLQKDPSEYRGRALAKYIDGFAEGAAKPPWQQVEPIFLARFAELAAVDFYAGYSAYLEIKRYTTEDLNAALDKLPPEQRAAIKKTARWYLDNWNAKQNKLTLPPYPADLPQPGFGWGKTVSSNQPPAGSSPTTTAANPAQMLTAPATAEEFTKLAFQQYDRQDYAGAVRSFSECLRLNARKLDCYLWRGMAHTKLKNHDPAIADFTEYLKSAPSDGEVYVERGWAYSDKAIAESQKGGKHPRELYESAIADFETGLKLKPQMRAANETRKAIEQAKKVNAAGQEQAAAVTDLNAVARVLAEESYQTGIKQFDAGNYDQAIESFSRCIAALPSAAGCYTERARSLLEKSKGEQKNADDLLKYDGVNVVNKTRLKALDDINRAIQLDGRSASDYQLRGALYLLEKIYDKALVDYRQALAVAPDLATKNALLHKFLLEKIIQVERQYSASLGIKGADAVQRGERLLQAKDAAGADQAYLQAIEFFTESIRLDKTNGSALYGRGTSHKYRKNYDQAIADYTEALKIKPDDAPTLVARASVYAVQKKTALALADYDRMIALPPTADKLLLDEALVGRGRVNLETGKLDQAIADFDRVLAENVNYVTAYFYRGQAHAQKKNKPQAIADFRTALEIAPEFVEAKAELKKLGVAP